MVTTSNENVEQQHEGSEESQLANLKGMRRKATTAIEDLFFFQKLNETSTRKLKHIEGKMATIHKDLVFFEGRIADIQKLISGKRGSTANTHTVPAREAESVVPMASIPSLRLLNDSMRNSKYFESNKVHPADASTYKVFKTIGAFLDKFELTLAYHRVNIDKKWYNYLQVSVQGGQDSGYIKWLKQRDQETNFKSSKWLEVREMLIEKF
ncbi:hypothetical protein RMATCC62417_10730 [Rhizopus microsporus]|nr:hypothetical protein RMATCC62417_10730 [Rhizopus microsporus]